jgi:hypothetical protein
VDRNETGDGDKYYDEKFSDEAKINGGKSKEQDLNIEY